MMPEEREIRAVYDADTIRVYQAYRADIAEEAVRLQTFGARFSMQRITWIKPSFRWMMYRSGWAEKPDQEHVLALDISRRGFDYAVTHAVMSSHRAAAEISEDAWKRAVQQSDIRCQWDPEKDVFGNSLPYRSIQLGLRGQAVQLYVNEWIQRVTDITEEVHEIHAALLRGENITARLPKEEVYPMPSAGV